MSPTDLVRHLKVLRENDVRNADFTRLHHDSMKGRAAYLSTAIAYFERTRSLQGNNLSLADRCKYVADQLLSGRVDKEVVIAEALARWPLSDYDAPTGEQYVQAESARFESLVAIVEADLQAAGAEVEGWEGKRTERLVAHYERNPHLRAAAVQCHGTACKACGFDFALTYGAHGADYIEVHHLVPVSTLGESRAVNPRTDMTVLCANCHRMVHRRRDEPLSLIELRALLGVTPSDA